MKRLPSLKSIKKEDYRLEYSIEFYMPRKDGEMCHVLHVYDENGNEVAYYLFRDIVSAIDFLNRNFAFDE